MTQNNIRAFSIFFVYYTVAFSAGMALHLASMSLLGFSSPSMNILVVVLCLVWVGSMGRIKQYLQWKFIICAGTLAGAESVVFLYGLSLPGIHYLFGFPRMVSLSGYWVAATFIINFSVSVLTLCWISGKSTVHSR